MRSPQTRVLSRALATVAALTLGAVALTSCSSSESEPSGSAAGENARTTLTYASGDAEPTCLDPHQGGNYPQALVGTQFAEGLVSRDSSGKIIPWLATDWKVSKNGLEWDFTLKDGVEFTDGTPLDWKAVKANVEHLQDPKTGSSTGYLAFAKIKKVTRGSSDLVAHVSLSQPDAALLESFSQTWNAIESPTALKRGLEENCTDPVGTGPFKVASWTKQDRVELVRNEDYTSAPADAENQDGASSRTRPRATPRGPPARSTSSTPRCRTRSSRPAPRAAPSRRSTPRAPDPPTASS